MFSILFVAASFAQETDSLPDAALPRQQFKLITEIDFGWLKVEGGRSGPEGVITYEPPRADHPSLIQLRVSFEEEMALSPNEVR